MKQPKIITFPPSRIGTLDMNVMSLSRPHIKALLEVDVTEAHLRLQERKKAGEDISFTAWMIYQIGQSLEKFPRMHALLRSKRSITVFETVDVSIMVEREHRGDKVPLVYVLRGTNTKDDRQITAEIRRAQEEPLAGDTTVLSGGGFSSFWANLYFRLPGRLRRWAFRLWLGNPIRGQRAMGSVIVTSLGMFGQIPGWFVHYSIHPLAFGIGAITRKPAVVGDQIVARDFLHLTVLMDHNVVDGAYMARFVADLCRRLEGKIAGPEADIHQTKPSKPN
jgi:pyruvate/2-oxoglutarate dehydrogenase complex dihydrolipoamide acyltransferase (E2) component